ncbi:hypothetical protein ACFQJ7_10780 [Halovenus rubra]|uniref:Uncharacterized protein n=2 Tax=Halovenus rubra TaxID=869890 RepID=A0ACC7E2F5_9EURY|nr:hypothetical protein [Halovenus rubra]
MSGFFDPVSQVIVAAIPLPTVRAEDIIEELLLPVLLDVDLAERILSTRVRVSALIL